MEFASLKLQNDQDVALAAVRQNGLLLKDLTGDMKADPEVVKAAVDQNVLAMEWGYGGGKKTFKKLTIVLDSIVMLPGQGAGAARSLLSVNMSSYLFV